MRIDRRAGAGVGQREADLAGLPRGGLVADLDGELDHIAFTDEPGRIRFDHQVLGRDHLVLEITAAQIPVVHEPHELPFGQGFGHGEFQADFAVFARDQVREEERRFVQIGAGRDLAQVGSGCRPIPVGLGEGIGAFGGLVDTQRGFCWRGRGRQGRPFFLLHRHVGHRERGIHRHAAKAPADPAAVKAAHETGIRGRGREAGAHAAPRRELIAPEVADDLYGEGAVSERAIAALHRPAAL